MTVAELIDRVLQVVREQFYEGQPDRVWGIHRPLLERSVARYGFACHRNGWEFEATEIAADLLAILPTIQAPKEFWIMPQFLESCIDRSIRQRAEKLQAAARKNERAAEASRRAMAKLQVIPADAVVRDPTTVEILSAFYLDRRRVAKSKPRKQVATPKPAVAQPALF